MGCNYWCKQGTITSSVAPKEHEQTVFDSTQGVVQMKGWILYVVLTGGNWSPAIDHIRFSTENECKDHLTSLKQSVSQMLTNKSYCKEVSE